VLGACITHGALASALRECEKNTEVQNVLQERLQRTHAVLFVYIFRKCRDAVAAARAWGDRFPDGGLTSPMPVPGPPVAGVTV